MGTLDEAAEPCQLVSLTDSELLQGRGHVIMGFASSPVLGRAGALALFAQGTNARGPGWCRVQVGYEHAGAELSPKAPIL